MGGTFSAKKFVLCVPSAEIVGHCCTYKGRVADPARVQRIKDWPECESLTDVRAFLGTIVYLRIFIKGFAFLAKPLVNLTKKGVAFQFDAEERDAMAAL